MTTDAVEHDLIHRFTLANDQLRGEIVTLKQTYADATVQQNLPPAVQQLLGEFLAAAALLGEILKFSGTLTLQVRGDGLVPLIMAEATSEQTLRGVAKIGEGVLSSEFSSATFSEIVGNGVLTLTIDPVQGQRYQGIVPIDGANLAACLSHYFSQSEQLSTRLWLSADLDVAGGVFLQQLPAAANAQNTPELWHTAVQLAATVKHQELAELPHATVLYRLFHELEVKLFAPKSMRFVCSCTRARSANALVALGEADAFELLKEVGVVSMDCEFCGANYSFNEADLLDLFELKRTEH